MSGISDDKGRFKLDRSKVISANPSLGRLQARSLTPSCCTKVPAKPWISR